MNGKSISEKRLKWQNLIKLNTMYKLGIVVPCFNEENVLNETVIQLCEIQNNLINEGLISSNSFVLLVDDGSKDATWSIIKNLHNNSKKVYGLKLANNVGHQNALLAGLIRAKEYSDIVISIDADLQDNPHIIKDMVKKYHEGYDIVYGIRNSRKKDTFFKRFTAESFYRLMKSLGVKTIFNHADFRLMSRRALDFLSKFEERNLFLRGIVPLIGYASAKVYYEREPRLAGESKYSLRKMLNFAIDGITSFSIRPLRIIFGLGFIILVLSCFALIYTLVSYFSGKTIPGWTSLILSVWFLGAIVLISIGIIGEYIGKIYTETKKRPRYNEEIFLSHEDNT